MVLEFLIVYASVFLLSLIAGASIFFPVPAALLISTIGGALLNPFIVTLFAALGVSIGEFTGYGLGYGAVTLLEKKLGKKEFSKRWEQTEDLFNKHGGFIIFVLSALPIIPFDFIVLYCGAIKYNPKKLFFFLFTGKIVYYLFLTLTGKALANFITQLVF